MSKVLLLAALLQIGATLVGARALRAEPTFEADVLPILKARCFACHSTGKRRHGLDVRQRQLLERGGDTGPALAPGDAEGSLFFRRAAAGEMPPGQREKVTAVELQVIRRWIEAGAPTARAETPLTDDDEFVTAEDREHWSFQQLERPPIPPSATISRARHPIDRFLEQRLTSAGLEFSGDAPRRTMIRRLSFDLLGLPPTPAAVESFVADSAPDAYERLVEKLLASPRYGERWGRHWLDAAGYADSEGYSDSDPVRASAWRYRDYVIGAFNTDKPYDVFLTEQLAGDEVARYPQSELDDTKRELLTATGYLRCAADGTGQGGDQKAARAQVVADTVKIFGSGVLGLTLGCAQCHDHRYDPISQKDYHRIRAAFEPALNLGDWKAPSARRVSLQTDEERSRAQKIDSAVAEKSKHRNEERKRLVDAAFEKELTNKVPLEKHQLARTAFRTAQAERNDEQKAIFARYPFLAVNGGNLYQYNPEGAEQIKKLDAELGKLTGAKPQEQFIRALWEEPGKIPQSRLLIRGDPDQPAEVVAPGTLAVLTPPTRSFTFAASVGEADATSKRRSRLVQWLTEPRHPLTARVFVNRVWMHHFGRGLVATPGDFGTQGEKPTHPKLLDWLACEFVDGGWSMKQLHRQILTSTAYRQASRARDIGLARDPENRLLWRKPLQRLEGEALRDALLATTGLLSTRIGGPPAPVREDAHGRIVVGVDKKAASNRPGKSTPAGEDGYRRTLYVSVRRSQPLSFTKAFDVPVMETNCVRRSVSTIAPQALTLLNGAFAREQAFWFAERLAKESPDLPARVENAFSLAYGRRPDVHEHARAISFLTDHATLVAARSADRLPSDPKTTKDRDGDLHHPEQEALVNFCQALMNSSEFLFID